MNTVLSVNSPVIPKDNTHSTFVSTSLNVQSREKIAPVASDVLAPDRVILHIGDPSESRLSQTNQPLGSRIVCLTITPNDGETDIGRRSGESLASSALLDGKSSIDSSSQLPLGSEVDITDPVDKRHGTIAMGSKKNRGELYRYVPSPLPDSVFDPTCRFEYGASCSYGPPDKEQKYLEQLRIFEARKEKGEILPYDAICRLEQALLKCQKEEDDAVNFKYGERLEKTTRFSKWEDIFTRLQMLKASFALPKVEPATPSPMTTATPTTANNRRSITIGCSVLAMAVIAGVGLLIRQYS